MLNKDPEDLKDIIHKSHPFLNITNNLDRTISIQSSEELYDLSGISDKAIVEWMGNDLTSSASTVYAVFKLNANSYLIKV